MIGFPFDSYVTFDEHGQPEYDRAISSQPLKNLLHRLFTNGILPDVSSNLEVIAGEGMNVSVKPGFCIIEGGLKLEEDLRTLSIQASNNNYSRIDSVVMRWNDNVDYRICDLYILTGTPAATPVRPELTREGGIYEIGLADILVTANSTVISDARITDTRYETARCGVISSLSEFDTTFIYNQVQADLAQYTDVTETNFTNWIETQQAAYENWISQAESGFGSWEDGLEQQFIDWFNTIRDILDEDTAGHLQNEIDGLNTRLTTVEGTVSGYDSQIASLTDDVGTIQGNITTIQSDITNIQGDVSNNTTAIANNTEEIRIMENVVELTLASSSWSSSTFTINGTAYYRQNSTNGYNVISNKILEMVQIPYSSSYTLPSEAEIEAYNKIDFMVYNDSDHLIYWYAKEKPTTSIKVKILNIKSTITT